MICVHCKNEAEYDYPNKLCLRHWVEWFNEPMVYSSAQTHTRYKKHHAPYQICGAQKKNLKHLHLTERTLYCMRPISIQQEKRKEMYYHDNYSYWRQRPTQNDFELEVISKHPDFNGRPLRKYACEGISTVGCWGDEPFEVHFHNKSHEDVQVRISLDGTDILTGKAASLEVNHDMWVVRAGRTLHLKAWAETNQGGARFVFTGADKSVALHAHGDISHKGIISAAVFTERDRPTPPRPIYRARAASATLGGFSGMKGMSTNSSLGRRDISEAAPAPGPAAAGSATPDAVMEAFGGMEMERSVDKMKSLKKEASIGAGEQVSQKNYYRKGS